MKFIAMIPARYAATRFPGKLMKTLGDKPVIVHTYLNTVETGLFDDVMVVTDSDIIFDAVTKYGGKAVMSRKSHESGSDRIAEAVEDLDAEVVVNVQGDEPFVQKNALAELLSVFTSSGGENVHVATLMQELRDPQLVRDPNYVKVVVDKKMNALLFSRSVIPYPRDEQIAYAYFEHIGIYAFRKQALLNFTAWQMTPLESVEKVECLRYLENGVSIRMVRTEYMGVEIDTPEDLEKAAKFLGL